MIVLAEADQYRVRLYRPYPSRRPWPFHGLIVYGYDTISPPANRSRQPAASRREPTCPSARDGVEVNYALNAGNRRPKIIP